jgi:hypothetical protein
VLVKFPNFLSIDTYIFHALNKQYQFFILWRHIYGLLSKGDKALELSSIDNMLATKTYILRHTFQTGQFVVLKRKDG